MLLSWITPIKESNHISFSEPEGRHQPEQLPAEWDHGNLGSRAHLWKYSEEKSALPWALFYELFYELYYEVILENTVRGKSLYYETYKKFFKDIKLYGMGAQSHEGPITNTFIRWLWGKCRFRNISCLIVAIILWFSNKSIACILYVPGKQIKKKIINNYCHNLSCPGKQTRNNCWWTNINKGIKAWKTSKS